MSEWKTFDEHPENPDSDVFITDFETVQVRNWIQAELFSGFAKSTMRWMEIDIPEVPEKEEIKLINPDRYEEGQCDAWDYLSFDSRLEIAEFIFKKITHSPCSFRRLIYTRLGFDSSAYAPLYDAGGMDITNGLWEGVAVTKCNPRRKIEKPEVPKKESLFNLSTHRCSNEWGTVICEENSEGLIVSFNELPSCFSLVRKVEFCPLCGYSIKKDE